MDSVYPSIDDVYLRVHLKINPIIVHKKGKEIIHIYIGTVMEIFLTS